MNRFKNLRPEKALGGEALITEKKYRPKWEVTLSEPAFRKFLMFLYGAWMCPAIFHNCKMLLVMNAFWEALKCCYSLFASLV